MSNHAGYYAELKEAVPAEIRDQIEWRTNDGGRIKVKEVVALACIPLSKISEEIAQVKIDLKQCYNSTARCSAYFNDIYEKVSYPKDAQQVLKDDAPGRLVASAISLATELIDVYDWLMLEFPSAYNDAGGKFGGTHGVRIRKEGEAPFPTRYRQQPGDYNYSDGFFMPILTSLHILIEREGDKLIWKQCPKAFIERNLGRVMRTYKGLIRNKDYDGRLVGRDPGAYELAYEILSMLLDMETTASI